MPAETLPQAAPPQPQCRCAPGADGILPPRTGAHGDWACVVCHLPRRHMVSLFVFAGARIDRCVDCVSAAQRTRAQRPKPTDTYTVAFTTCMSGTWRSTHTEPLCPACLDAEVARWRAGGAEITDGRQPAPTTDGASC